MCVWFLSFCSLGRPFINKPASHAHQLLSFRDGDNDVLLRSYQRQTQQIASEQSWILSWEGEQWVGLSGSWWQAFLKKKKKGPGIMIAVLKSLLESSWVPLYLQSFLQHRSRAAESCQGLLPVTRDVAWLVECWPHMHEAIGSVFSTK